MTSEQKRSRGRPKVGELPQVAFKMEQKMLDKINVIAKQDGVNRSFIIRKAIEQFILSRTQKKKMSDESINDTINGNNNYENQTVDIDENEKLLVYGGDIFENFVSTLFFLCVKSESNPDTFYSKPNEEANGLFTNGMCTYKNLDIFDVDKNKYDIYTTKMPNKEILYLSNFVNSVALFVNNHKNNNFDFVTKDENEYFFDFCKTVVEKFSNQFLSGTELWRFLLNIIDIGDYDYRNPANRRRITIKATNKLCSYFAIIAKTLKFNAFEIRTIGYGKKFVVLPGVIFKLAHHDSIGGLLS